MATEMVAVASALRPHTRKRFRVPDTGHQFSGSTGGPAAGVSRCSEGLPGQRRSSPASRYGAAGTAVTSHGSRETVPA